MSASNSFVKEARWDDETKKWRTAVSQVQGSKESEFQKEYTLASDFLVSAVGQLNQPKWPDIPGVDSFSGKTMHSARWDWSYDVTDKKVAMLGSGCTSAQIVPEIAKIAKHVTVFQRTPNYIFPRLDQPVSSFWQSVYKYVPPVRWRKRAKQMDFRESFYDAVTDSESANADMIRNFHKQKLETELAERPDLWDKLTPKYNPGCKRIIISDDYFPVFAQPNVDLETRKIDSISGNTVKVQDENGNIEVVEPEFDLLVCATGFKTVDFMHPIELYGKNGRSLSDVWEGGARAFYGVGVEDMPNFAMLYGPNTNLGHNSIVLMSEAQSRYINGLIKPVLDARKQGKALSLKPKLEKLEEFNKQIQTELLNSSFNDPNCNSWYKTEKGVITNNWSRTVINYQELLADVNYDDYDAEGSGANLVRERRKLHVGRVKEETAVSDTTLMILGGLSTAAVVGGWLMRNSRYLQRIRVR